MRRDRKRPAPAGTGPGYGPQHGIKGVLDAHSVARRRARWDGSEFRELRLLANLDRRACAAFLRVSERTVRNWERGVCCPPYSAFKLMRILRCYELPGEAWRGWYLKGDTLWSPEQKGFQPFDMGWWSLTVSAARAWFKGRASWSGLRGGRMERVSAPVRPPRSGGPILVVGTLKDTPSRSVAASKGYGGTRAQGCAHLTQNGANVCVRASDPRMMHAAGMVSAGVPSSCRHGALERAATVAATGRDAGRAGDHVEGESDEQACERELARSGLRAMQEAGVNEGC